MLTREYFLDKNKRIASKRATEAMMKKHCVWDEFVKYGEFPVAYPIKMKVFCFVNSLMTPPTCATCERPIESLEKKDKPRTFCSKRMFIKSKDWEEVNNFHRIKEAS